MSDSLLQLSTHELHVLAAALRTGRVTPPYSAMSLQRFLPAPTASGIVASVQRFESLGFTSEQLATVLDLIAAEREHRPSLDEVVELVTTSPDAPGVVTRDTAVVVRELFCNAVRSVVIAGYAVYQGRHLFQSLADRMTEVPSLNVRMYLDIQRAQGDTSMPSELVRRFVERFRSQHWPEDCRLPALFYDSRSLDPQAEKRACLHAKCIIVDEAKVFISSANFTEAAQLRNIEVGLLLDSSSIAKQVLDFFDALSAYGHLTQMA